jgi:Holliday junction resolvasome RuvABC ATP-dependent DNA helicase subunit
LNGKCSLEFTDSQKRITPRVLSSNDLFGFRVLFDVSIHTNKVIAITELICLKMDVNTLKKDQNLMDAITPNLMRSMMKSFIDSEDRMSDLKDTVQKSDAVIEDRVKPQIIKEKLSKLTRLRLHSGRVIVISAIDMRRMRRDHITAQQLNDEHFAKVS